MNRLFPLPFYTFLKIVSANGGIGRRGWRNTAPWLVKTVLFEPLRWVEILRYQKRIQQHVVPAPPVFILGYYRSGTTYLQQLFMQDNRLGYTSSFQMVFPEIMLGFENALTPVLEKTSRLLKIQNPVHRIPLTWYSPGEDDVAMTTGLHPMAAQWGYFFPQKMPDYFRRSVLFEGIGEEEKEAWKQAYFFLVKKFSLANGAKQLVLKTPPNTARIPLLLSLFPDACFVFLHRNPYEVFASNKRLWNVVQDIYTLGSTRAVNHTELILDSYEKITERYLADRKLIPKRNLVELPYQTLVQDPVGCMQQLYASLRLPDFNECEEKMAAFAGRQKEYVRLQHRLPEDERMMVTERWAPFIKEWGYPVE